MAEKSEREGRKVSPTLRASCFPLLLSLPPQRPFSRSRPLALVRTRPLSRVLPLPYLTSPFSVNSLSNCSLVIAASSVLIM